MKHVRISHRLRGSFQASVLALPALLPLHAMGQALPTAPDAGRLLQQDRPAPAAPRPSPALPIQPAPVGAGLPAGGAQVQIQAIAIEGLSQLAPEPFIQALGPVQGQRYDLAALRALAEQVGAAVRAAGYPFARAYLPVQDLAGGKLRIAVREGRYGQVSASDAQAQAWLDSLQSGEPIQEGALQRSLLLLSDLPGITSQPLLRPGAEAGSGDLLVQVDPPRPVAGRISLDNHGNRYAGRERLGGGLDFYSLAVWGDQLGLLANVTSQGTWQGSAAYSMPIGSNGLRANFSASRTDYELGKEFASLGAHGTADTWVAGLSYPLLRSQKTNVRVSAALQTRHLRDLRDAIPSSEKKRANAGVVELSADHTDELGVSWATLSLTQGHLTLDASLKAADDANARSAGSFGKLTLDAVRLQALGGNWTVYGRVAGQWASKNLDSSEKFVLGGPTGVRAWPSGEGTGDEGLLAQVELRFRHGPWEPYAFVDAGQVKLNRTPWAAGNNHRNIAGAGLGVRWNQGPWQLNGTLGWRGGDGQSQTEPNTHAPQIWVALGYRF